MQLNTHSKLIWVSLILLGTTLFSAEVAQYKMNTPPVWNGTPKEVNDSIGTNNGTAKNGLTNTGSVGSFDGTDDYIELSSELSALRATGTLSAWIKTTQTGDNTMWRAPGIAGIEQAGGGDDIFWGWIDATGHMGMTYSNQSPTKSTTAINDNVWHHVVFTRDSGTGEVVVYVDGQEEARATRASGTVSASRAFRSLGRIEDTGGSPEYYKGDMKELRIFDTVLTPTEVKNIYDALDTDGDTIYDINDVDDDNDGILDEYENRQYDSYVGGSGGSVHANNYIYSSSTWVQIDLETIDSGFNLDINGTFVLAGGKYIEFELATDATRSKFLFADNATIYKPWIVNDNGLPRVRLSIDDTGNVIVEGTRSNSSTQLEVMHPNDSTAYNTLAFPAGTYTITVENMNGSGADSINGSNKVGQLSVLNINQDIDGDGFLNRLDLDSDNDGIPDNVEAQATVTYDVPSATWADADGDGLADQYDTDSGGTAVTIPNTDGDGIPDFLDSDSDNDGYTDCEEGYVNADCSNIIVGNNGMASWVENSDIYWDTNTNHAVSNGKVSEPDPDNSGQLQDEVTGNNEAAYRELFCGKANYTLTQLQWRLISIPCDTGNNEVQHIFSSLGTYGNNAEWVMYKQTGDDNYEINAAHKNTNKTMLDANSTLEQGISYWIITDANHTVNVSKLLPLTIAVTSTDDANQSSINITDSDFTKVAEFPLPVASDVNVKKYMAGNPFPFSFDMSNLYFRHNDGTGSYKSMEDNASNGTYINPTFYKHDSSDTGPVNGYTAITPSTPGFNAPILPMEGFFIKLEKNTDIINDNNFSYPLTYGKDK